MLRAFNDQDAGPTFKGAQVRLVRYIPYGIDFDDLLFFLFGDHLELDVSVP